MSARLPLNFPADLTIRIFSNSEGYVADICNRHSDWWRGHIGLSQHDVAERNEELHQALESLSISFETDNPCQDALSRLAEIGNDAFKAIFADKSLRKTLSKILKEGSTIQFVSEDFFIPWELLYDGPIGHNVDVTRFWGMRYIISRSSTKHTIPADLESFEIGTSFPSIGLVACNELEYVTKEEIPVLQKYCKNKQIALSLLRPLEIQLRDEELMYFGHFLSQDDFQIIHFACHACEQELQNDSYLLVSNGFFIRRRDFNVYEFGTVNRPFVILNACLTGTSSPLYTSSWVNVFREHGARGVLATEFHVPDKFAPLFAEELYKRFLSGKPIGKALLDARRSLWQRRKNPLGLAYALYSSPMIRIARRDKEKN